MRKPLVMAHGINTRNAYDKILDADIIEFDVRKSRDGVLFCFHGSKPFGFLLAYWLKVFPWNVIKKIISAEPLDHVVSHIAGDPIVFCDIKQRNINANDLSKVFDAYAFKSIWFAAISFSYLAQLRTGLGGGRYRYIYNFGLFPLVRGIRLAKKVQVDVVQLFFWQHTPSILTLLGAYNIDHAACSMFLSRKRYESLAVRHASLWIYYDYR